MPSEATMNVVSNVMNLIALAIVVLLGVTVLTLVAVFFYDRMQRRHAILRNFPVLGHLRYFFEYLGAFFRQYFFAADREEMPFNRAQRTWVYQAAKDEDNTVAFGSSRLLTPIGTVMFVNCPFPTLEAESQATTPITIGEACKHPYTTSSFFNISGMSFGAISENAVRALSNGAAKAGIWLNTGEGGLSPYHMEGGCDIVFQIGTAKYGVRNDEGHLSEQRLAELAAFPNIKMFEIKLSQGAKPGKGGILPGEKVTEEIAFIRGIPAYQDSISPNRHIEIVSVGDLLDMVERVRSITGKPTGFKCVIGAYGWIDELCAEILKRGEESAPDFITIDSADGGTGAAPAPLIDYVGLPISESLPIVVDMLTRHKLRNRIKIITSGKLINPAEVAWALCMGADFVTSARGFMFALGCVQSLQCNKNTCPTGVATHDKSLQKGLDPTIKAVRVANYAKNIEKDVGMIAHSCGVSEPRRLRRFHARIVMDDGRTKGLDEIYPDGVRPLPPTNM